MRWESQSGQLLREKQLGLTLKPNKTARFDLSCGDPFTKEQSTLHRVAVKVKFGPGSLKNSKADHNAGWGRWGTLNWRKRPLSYNLPDRDCG